MDKSQFEAPLDDPACDDAVADVSLQPSGTFTLDEAGNLDTMLTASVEMTLSISEACLSALAGKTLQWTAAVCTDYGDALQDEIGGTASCSLSGNACRCAISQSAMPLTSSTMFTIEGNELIESDGTVSSFCQDGDTLRVASPIGTMVFSRR